jgi:hypothetical protein
MSYNFRTDFLQGTDASLQVLYLSTGVFSPPFAPAGLAYKSKFPAGGVTATLFAATTDSAASITAGSGKPKRGQINQAVPVPYGSSVIQITVVSENLANVTVYSINIEAPLADTWPPGSPQNPPPLSTQVPGSPTQVPGPPSSNPTTNNPSFPPTNAPYPPPLSRFNPTVIFSSVPVSRTQNTSAQFSFHATEWTGDDCTGCRFYCALDSGALQPCTFSAPSSGVQQTTYWVSLTSLSEGAHSFHVSTSNAAGFSSAVSSYFWVIDLTPPVSRITANVPTIRPTSVQNVVFNISVLDQSDRGELTGCPTCISQCQMDLGSFVSCYQGQPVRYRLQPGPHMFSVRSMDASGNEEATPVRISFVVST